MSWTFIPKQYHQQYPFTLTFECPWSLSHCFYEFLWFILWMLFQFSHPNWIEQALNYCCDSVFPALYPVLTWLPLSLGVAPLRVCLCLNCGRSLWCSRSGILRICSSSFYLAFLCFSFNPHILYSGISLYAMFFKRVDSSVLDNNQKFNQNMGF